MTKIVLVAVSPRFPTLFTPRAWRALDAADPVLVAGEDHPALPALKEAGVSWELLRPVAPVAAGTTRQTDPDGTPSSSLPGRGSEDAISSTRALAATLLPLAEQRRTTTFLLPPGDGRALVGALDATGAGVEAELLDAAAEPTGSALLDLVATEARLRGPGGCLWDHEQTHASLARHLLEETYETLEAIDEGDPEHLREELGDLLLQVVFHAQIAADGGRFDIDDVAGGLNAKLVRRHPHVFGDTQVASAAEVAENWARIKREQEGRKDPMSGIPASLPALQLAAKLQRRAATTGLVWSGRDGALEKLREELGEFLEAVAVDEPDQEAVDWEAGDLLFAAVALVRSAHDDPEGALRRASGRFRGRYERARALAEADGQDADRMPLERWYAYWAAAKQPHRPETPEVTNAELTGLPAAALTNAQKKRL